MRKPTCFLALALLVAAGMVGCGKRGGSFPDKDIARFITAKRSQIQELADATNGVPKRLWRFFDAVQRNDWPAATNLFARLQAESGRNYVPPAKLSPLSEILRRFVQGLGLIRPPSSALRGEIWSPVSETIGIYEQFHDWDGYWMRRFGCDIIDSIPTNSIYFGGTDPGRFVISALCDSHRDGRPFFTLTQNQLADITYLTYLQTMYGHALSIPTANDSQQAFQSYLTDAQRRLQKKELKPGENVQIVNNRVQVSGQTAVMQINGLLVKVIVDKNPGRDVYVEESFALDWMYPQLEPHGLIMKLNREPLAALSEDTVRRDREYWKKYAGDLIGDWITDETTVKDICNFSEKIYLRKDLAGFKGSAAFARNEAAQKSFSKLRSSIGGLYAWRAERSTSDAEKQRMTREADFAFKQAFALCPYLPEGVNRSVILLREQNRDADARLIAETFKRFPAAAPYAKDLMEKLK